jgi:hypothetical protein
MFSSKPNSRAPEGVIEHIEKNIGPIFMTFQEIVSDDLKLDIHHIRSGLLFSRYEIIVTSGMSAKKMTVPEAYADFGFAELMVVLPKGWPISVEAFTDENVYWPIRMLKDIARFAHHNNTWVGFGHTIASGHSEETTVPYAPNTSLCASLIVPSLTVGESAWQYKRRNADTVHFYSAVPLHLSELKFKLENGVDALLDVFDRNKVTDRIDPKRKNVV